jgi:hypothetical protein
MVDELLTAHRPVAGHDGAARVRRPGLHGRRRAEDHRSPRGTRRRLGATLPHRGGRRDRPDTIAATARAGADTFVAGSAMFGASDRERAARELLALAAAELQATDAGPGAT